MERPTETPVSGPAAGAGVGASPAPRGRDEALRAVLWAFAVSGAVVAAGGGFAGLLKSSPKAGHRFYESAPGYANWDGQWYLKLAREGYTYRAGNQSSVAFFPAYPLAARLVARATGVEADEALLLVSNACFLACLPLVYDLAARSGAGRCGQAPRYAVAALALAPTSFFFRVAYSESMFLLAAALLLVGSRRRWPLPVLAAVAGFGTATRPVGVALLVPVLWRCGRGSGSAAGFARRAALVVPLGCWGLIAYAGFLGSEFGDPLAFVKTQRYWQVRRAPGLGGKLVAHASLAPLRPAFGGRSADWRRFDRPGDPLFTFLPVDVAAPVVVLGLLGLGWRRGWVDGPEAAFGVACVLIPYWSVGYECCLRSMGRFSSVAVPAYVVLGRLLAGCPPPVRAALTVFSGLLLGAYTALFCAGYHLV